MKKDIKKEKLDPQKFNFSYKIITNFKEKVKLRCCDS